jgi:CCR4-NOT transcription complex subunit 3
MMYVFAKSCTPNFVNREHILTWNQPHQIENLKDDVDFYIENNSEPDFVENEGIYDELGLDDIQLAVNHDDDDDLGTDSEDDPISDDEPSPPPSRSASQTPSKKAPVRTSMEDERPPAAARVTPVPVAEKPKPEPMPLAPTAAAPKAAQPKAAFVAKKTEPVKVEERRAAVPPSPAKADPPKKSAVAAPSAAEDKREDPRSKQVATSSLSMSGHIEPPVALPSQVAQHQPIGPSPQAQAAAASGIPLPLLSLQSSFNHLPESIDIGRPTHYKPRVPSSVPSYYPTTPASIFENPALYEKLDTDTLFFVFYYQQGTYQQYLAAKELKRQSWRYHKKYLTWFQRHEEPKEITTDYEQGTYVYFDYETGWCQRKKTEFTFQYRYLEDKDLL